MAREVLAPWSCRCDEDDGIKRESSDEKKRDDQGATVLRALCHMLSHTFFRHARIPGLIFLFCCHPKSTNAATALAHPLSPSDSANPGISG
jgi:hypothetical protein